MKPLAIAQSPHEIRPAFTAAEAAGILKLHPVFFRRLMHRGQVPGAVRLGRTWRLPAHALDAILRSGLAIHRARKAGGGR